jgi:hypothetical protein
MGREWTSRVLAGRIKNWIEEEKGDARMLMKKW